MDDFKAYWTEDEKRSIANATELQQIIHDAKALGKPIMLFLEYTGGRTMVVGLGAERSVLTFVEGDGTSFHSVGDAGEQGILKFWCRDQLDEFMAEMAIPEAVAVAAAKSFQLSGERPSEVSWEADW